MFSSFTEPFKYSPTWLWRLRKIFDLLVLQIKVNINVMSRHNLDTVRNIDKIQLVTAVFLWRIDRAFTGRLWRVDFRCDRDWTIVV